MAIDIKLDLVGNPEPLTIILANKNGNQLGQLKVNEDSVDLADRLVDASEISFTVNKYLDNQIVPLWDKLVDFKLVYCKEWNRWFEIKVELDEETESVKTVFCTQLGQAELSQIMLYNVEINTEKDIERDDYKISILWDENDPKASILDRTLEKAPHYSILHVDDTIKNIQRSFSFNDTSIHDSHNEIAEEIGCLFKYHSNSNEGGKIQRAISVYDLQQNCNDCGHRGEFTDKCPKCGSTNIKYGYGKDTLIFVTSDELAAEGIQLVTDTDSVKNCFKLEAGDDLMTATIRNCNPNGSDYIWRFSDSIKEDMSDELVNKIETYNTMYKDYSDNYISNIDSTLLSKYNALVTKYSAYRNDLQSIATPIKGYPNLMNAYYNTIDLALYLNSGLMPSVEISETDALKQAGLLTSVALSPVAVNVDDIKKVSLATANSAVLSMAKIIVKPTYKVEINTSTLSDDKETWTGNFIVTNYSDEEDTVISGRVSVTINNNTETFIKQKIEKALNKEDTDDYSISGLFKRDYDDFCAELKKYALNPLKSFYDSCDSCLDVLIDQGAGDKKNNPDLYESLYLPFYNKSSALAKEIKVREDEIAVIEGVWDKTNEDNPKLKTKGLQYYIEKCRNTIQDNLDFEKYLGAELWTEFCSYRREGTYTNENYISDGLDNAELFKKAMEFIEVAENEIYKSSELQHSISTGLKNLLAIDKFKSLVDSFEVGNWIRVRVDDEIYKLRLLEYEIDFGNFSDIPVEFSDVTKVKNGITDIENVLSQAASMATSYSSTQRQAKQGENVQGIVDQWLSKGLNSALVRIQNNDDEEVILDKNGLLCRSYDDITEAYSPEQFRLTHNIMAYTTDNWETVSSALGKHEYTRWQDNQWIRDTDYGLSSKFVTAGYVTGSQIIGGEIVSSNYQRGVSGTYFNLVDGDFEIAGGNIVYDTRDKALTLKNVTIEWANTNTPEVKDITGLDEYLDQLDQLEEQFDKLDGRAETWYQSSDPSVNWGNDDLKASHIGDLWHYTGETATVNGVKRIKNSEWIWLKVDGVYQWDSIEISDDVFDAIDGKAQIFTSTPTPPYNVGDLWVQGSAGDILHCIKSKTEVQSFNASDWEKSSKYTDDTVAQQALEQAKKAIEDAADGIRFAEAAQKAAEDAQKAAEDAEKAAEDAEKNANDYTDGKNKTLSETLTEAYKEYTESKVSDLDDAVSDYLGLGGSTLLGENFIISPYIGGGYLNITNTTNNSRVIVDPNNLTGNGYIFQVHNGSEVSVGVDKNGNASFSGNIKAKSLELGSGVKIPYSKLSGTPTIPTSVTDLTGGANILYSTDVSISNVSTNDGTTKKTITVGDSTFNVIENGDFVLLGNPYGTNSSDGSSSYTYIAKDGLLTAKNAVIYGEIYSTKGLIGNLNLSNNKLFGLSESTNSYISGINTKFNSSTNNDIFLWAGARGGSDVPQTTTKEVFGKDNWTDAKSIIESTASFYVTHEGELVSQVISSGDYNFETGYKYAALDARNCLRIACGMDTANDIQKTRYDIDGDGRITAADARLVMRRAAQMEKDRVTSLTFTGEGLHISDESSIIFSAGRQGVYIHELETSTTTTEDTTSDIKVKNTVELLNDNYDTLFDNLIPRRFKYNHGTSDRFHTGFIAQEVVEALEKSNLTTQDFATVIHFDTPISNGAEWALRKEEMIALNTWQIQKSKKRIAELESKVVELEEKINRLIGL